MEKLIKIYSNNSKPARLKRRKNKFQRIWDSEKQTYVKVKKAKFANRTQPTKRADLNSIDIDKKMKSIEKSKQCVKKKKLEAKPTVQRQKSAPARKIHAKKDVTVSVKLYGNTLAWDQATCRYRKVALY